MSEILVADSYGNRVTVYQREFREQLPASQSEMKRVAYELITGERVKVVDKDTFVSARTGAKFVRVPDE
jgi:hypothetical protein